MTSGDDSPFFVQIEPEGMMYEFPPHERVLLIFRGRRALQHMELTHYKDALGISRPGDCEVWAALTDGTLEQIAGFADIKAPWIDSGNDAPGRPPWEWPPPPEDLKL